MNDFLKMLWMRLIYFALPGEVENMRNKENSNTIGYVMAIDCDAFLSKRLKVYGEYAKISQ